ncbi:hypothetical protein BDV25DRAFT_133908 [Aspergillus avenaceus]|uniref:Uncharacterized protein n=1 Tax=Aspergillus avenaceus TaxID=36643 RepID=A0A5N6TGT0_ASPAV|nr:hypothetical protein BDV25DRAFT_133908 [Aspergillus avenaceus]
MSPRKRASSNTAEQPPSKNSRSATAEEAEPGPRSKRWSKISKKVPCDGGKKCPCRKPASEYPEYPWIITPAGYRKLSHQFLHVNPRTPDLFDMSIYNDFEGFGTVEVLQNLVLDFVEAKDNWKEHNACLPLTQIEDGELANDTFCLNSAMLLTILAQFDLQGLLGPDSEACKILAYAKKYNIQLQGPSDLDKKLEDLEGADLPPPGDDPWGWSAILKEYEKNGYGRKPKIGGDRYDITAMSSADRKSSSFENKDPLGPKERADIKKGLILLVAWVRLFEDDLARLFCTLPAT